MLVNREPPEASLALLARELSVAAVDGRLAAYLEQPVRIETLSVTAPHRFFVLNADDLADDAPSPTAHYGGWRYLLEVNRRVVAIATTVIDKAGRHRFGGVATGPAVAAVVFAVHVADELLRVRSADFEAAAIEVPALHTVLFQLSNKDGSEVAFLPIGLATALHPAHLYSQAQIRVELQRMASRVRSETTEDGPIGG